MDVGNREVAFIFEDVHQKGTDERYKMLCTALDSSKLAVNDELWVSAEISLTFSIRKR